MTHGIGSGQVRIIEPIIADKVHVFVGNTSLVVTGTVAIAGTVPVSIAGTVAVSIAGTVAVSIAGTVTTATAGAVAHDAADTGNPLKIGMKAVDLAESPTAVAKDDRTDVFANRHGIPFVLGGHPNVTRYHTQRTSSGTTSNAIAAPGSGKRIVITALSAYSDGDSTATCRVTFQWNGGDIVARHEGVAAGSGFVEGSGAGILAIGPDNTGLNLLTDATADIDFHVTYFVVEG